MKITVINGNQRHGSTWHTADAVIRELKKYGETEIKEFFLPKDMPHFCMGCFTCFVRGEEKCPHYSAVKPIAEALLDADLIVLASPVYALDATGQMKALLDHLCYMWLSHRPEPQMFNKVGLIVTTTAGAGLRHTAKTLSNSLTFWGVKKIFKIKYAVAAMSWEEVSEKKKLEIEAAAKKKAAEIANAVKNSDSLRKPIFRKIMFTAVKNTMKKNKWNPLDINFWKAKGWLGDEKPF